MIILAGQSLGAKRARHYLVLQAVRLIQWLTEIRAETAANPCFFRLKVEHRRTSHNGHKCCDNAHSSQRQDVRSLCRFLKFEPCAVWSECLSGRFKEKDSESNMDSEPDPGFGTYSSGFCPVGTFGRGMA
jgi:hypothetical protein